jgi:hypothetical protein
MLIVWTAAVERGGRQFGRLMLPRSRVRGSFGIGSFTLHG